MGSNNPPSRRSFGTTTIAEMYAKKNFNFFFNSDFVISYGFIIMGGRDEEGTATSSDSLDFLIFHMPDGGLDNEGVK